jgi:hypothetical protein
MVGRETHALYTTLCLHPAVPVEATAGLTMPAPQDHHLHHRAAALAAAAQVLQLLRQHDIEAAGQHADLAASLDTAHAHQSATGYPGALGGPVYPTLTSTSTVAVDDSFSLPVQVQNQRFATDLRPSRVQATPSMFQMLPSAAGSSGAGDSQPATRQLTAPMQLSAGGQAGALQAGAWFWSPAGAVPLLAAGGQDAHTLPLPQPSLHPQPLLLPGLHPTLPSQQHQPQRQPRLSLPDLPSGHAASSGFEESNAAAATAAAQQLQLASHGTMSGPEWQPLQSGFQISRAEQ